MDKKSMPNKVPIPKLFRHRFKLMLGREYKRFLEYSLKKPKRGIRINTLKAPSVSWLLSRFKTYGWKVEQVPWYEYGYWITTPEDVKPGNTLEGFLGMIYGQDPSSMIPPLLLDVEESPEDHVVIDMCASPGSKTSMIAQLMGNMGIIIANDLKQARIKPLTNNLRKLGVVNTIITNYDGLHLPRVIRRMDLTADRILVDAPCSSEGTIRYNWRVLSSWSLEAIHRFASLQKRLLSKAVEMIKPGGVVVYSTCTLAPEENEGVVSWVLDKYSDVYLEKVRLPGLRYHPGIVEWDGVKYREELYDHVLRVYPHDNDSEGFFIARLRKEE